MKKPPGGGLSRWTGYCGSGYKHAYQRRARSVRNARLKLLLMISGGIAIVVLSFLATLYAIDRYDAHRSPDDIRTSNAKAVITALEKYRAAKGSYPVLAGRPL